MKTALVFNPDIKNYTFGPGHPFTGGRFEKFIRFAKQELGNFNEIFKEVVPPSASEESLRLVHSQEYIEAISRASRGIILPNITRYATSDNLNPATGYLPKGIHEAAMIAVGTSLEAAELVRKGGFLKAAALGGGLHHAKREKGEGFCIYNDVAVCAKKLLAEGVKRILVLDTDAHAGNGTSELLTEEKNVLLIDIHQDPATIYPGTGFIEEIGMGEGKGFTINIPLSPGAGDRSYEYVFESIIFPMTEEFQPELIIRSGGSDPYFADGLTGLGLTLKGFRMIGKNVKMLSSQFCQGKEIDLIASGYNPQILPQAWLALLGGLLDFHTEVHELQPSPFREGFRLEETKKTVSSLRGILKKYWRCFK